MWKNYKVSLVCGFGMHKHQIYMHKLYRDGALPPEMQDFKRYKNNYVLTYRHSVLGGRGA